LAVLERDGLVQQNAVRRGVGKPAFVYSLTEEAERFFPKGYETALRHLLDVLIEDVGAEQREELLREAGIRIAREANVKNLPSMDIRERLEQCIGVLNNLGGL